MAIIVDDQIELSALKKTLKEFNSLMKDLRVPNYSSAFTFCIFEDKLLSMAKEIKEDFDNGDVVGIFGEAVSDCTAVSIDYPESNFHTQAVDGLSNQLVRISTVRSYAPQVSMFETQEFIMFKFQVEQKLKQLLSSSSVAKEHKLSVSIDLEAYCKDDSGKLSQMGNEFKMNLIVTLFQL